LPVVTQQDQHQSMSAQNPADLRLWTDVSVVRMSLMLTVQLPHSQMTDGPRPHQPCCRHPYASCSDQRPQRVAVVVATDCYRTLWASIHCIMPPPLLPIPSVHFAVHRQLNGPSEGEREGCSGRTRPPCSFSVYGEMQNCRADNVCFHYKTIMAVGYRWGIIPVVSAQYRY